jgi:hypothetical protein
MDQVDYTSGACRVTEMVGAVLSKDVIELAKEAIRAASDNALQVCQLLLRFADSKYDEQEASDAGDILAEAINLAREVLKEPK